MLKALILATMGLVAGCLPQHSMEEEHLAAYADFEAAVLRGDEAQVEAMVDREAIQKLQPILDRLTGHGSYAKEPDQTCLKYEAIPARRDASKSLTAEHLRHILPAGGPIDVRSSGRRDFAVALQYGVTGMLLSFRRERDAWRLVGFSPPIEAPVAPEFRCLQPALPER